MRDSTFCCSRGALLSLLSSLLSGLLLSCGKPPADHAVTIQVFQDWQLKPGDQIAGYAVVGGLGDIAIDIRGGALYAPFPGEARQDKQGCLFYSSAELPAYRFRLCGVYGGGWLGRYIPRLNRLRLGSVAQGDTLGHANIVHFATLRKQPNGQWAIVEPDKTLIKRLLTPPERPS